MASTALISIFCPDKPGLIASVTSSLFDLGINLAATTFSVLGTGAEFTAVAEYPDEVTLEDIESDLNDLDLPSDAKIRVTPFTLESTHGPSGRITHRIAVSGGDQPGLIARLCEVFVQYDANIVRMNAERLPASGQDQYIIRFSVWLPEKSADTCLATVSNTAGELQLSCSWEEA